MLEYDGELADGGGIPAPLEVVVFVVVDVVVFVCPSLLFVVVLSYPPVIFVVLPDVLLCVLVSLANDTVLILSINVSITNNIMLSFISPPEEKL